MPIAVVVTYFESPAPVASRPFTVRPPPVDAARVASGRVEREAAAAVCRRVVEVVVPGPERAQERVTRATQGKVRRRGSRVAPVREVDLVVNLRRRPPPRREDLDDPDVPRDERALV